MNRDIIEPGRNRGKWAESFGLAGGCGALVYPLIFYYVGYVTIHDKEEFAKCTTEERIKLELENLQKNESKEITDQIRLAIQINLTMFCLFLLFHFIIFSRPESYRLFKRWGVVFSVVIAIQIFIGVATFIMTGISVCNDGEMGGAALLSSLALIIINLGTLIFAVIYFGSKTRVRNAQVAVAGDESVRGNDVTGSDVNAS